MKHLLPLALLASLATRVCLAETIDFDRDDPGKLPAGWTGTKTGKGEPNWAVVADASAPSQPNVLKQSGDATYPLCIKQDTRIQDGFVEVKFKALSGKVDQAGGVLWRCQDADHYYVARANALEDNLRIYHVKDGKRVQFKTADLKITAQEWHTLRVDFAGSKFTVTFDGAPVLEATDDTFKDAGRVGVWTKADSVTLFDDFRYGSR
jgi:hypothetical protein